MCGVELNEYGQKVLKIVLGVCAAVLFLTGCLMAIISRSDQTSATFGIGLVIILMSVVFVIAFLVFYNLCGFCGGSRRSGYDQLV